MQPKVADKMANIVDPDQTAPSVWSWSTLFAKTYEPRHDKTNKTSVLPSLIRVFAVRMKSAWVRSYLLSTQWRLIRLGGCPGWSESSLGAHSFCWFCHVAAHILKLRIIAVWPGSNEIRIWAVTQITCLFENGHMSFISNYLFQGWKFLQLIFCSKWKFHF